MEVSAILDFKSIQVWHGSTLLFLPSIGFVCLSSDPFCFSLSSRLRMSEKYAHLARMRELENIKSSFIDAMAYIRGVVSVGSVGSMEPTDF